MLLRQLSAGECMDLCSCRMQPADVPAGLRPLVQGCKQPCMQKQAQAHLRAQRGRSEVSSPAWGDCVAQAPAEVSRMVMPAPSDTILPPPTAPPEMCMRGPTKTAPCWYRGAGISPATALVRQQSAWEGNASLEPGTSKNGFKSKADSSQSP